MIKIPILYKKYFIDKGIERLGLFQLLNKKYSIENAIYPGSFVHITPSFIFKEVTYIDNDKRMKSFFSDDETLEYINSKKEYPDTPVIDYYEEDYKNIKNNKIEYFDLMISMYAGFVSKYCKDYIKHNGLLIVNDSHGDASLAFLDDDYKLIAGIEEENNKYQERTIDLEKYFKKKKEKLIDRDRIYKNMKGENYIHTAYAYIFRKIK